MVVHLTQWTVPHLADRIGSWLLTSTSTRVLECRRPMSGGCALYHAPGAQLCHQLTSGHW